VLAEKARCHHARFFRPRLAIEVKTDEADATEGFALDDEDDTSTTSDNVSERDGLQTPPLQIATQMNQNGMINMDGIGDPLEMSKLSDDRYLRLIHTISPRRLRQVIM
jgi:hypothetical protein